VAIAAAVDTSRPVGNRRQQQVKSGVLHILIVAYFIVAIFPFAWIVGMSLKKPADVVADPPVIFFTPTLENY
jgi:multiple sugar transport system permease protein